MDKVLLEEDILESVKSLVQHTYDQKNEQDGSSTGHYSELNSCHVTVGKP